MDDTYIATEDIIKAKLDELDELYCSYDAAKIERMLLVEEVMKPIRHKVDEIDAEFQPKFDAIEQKIAQAEQEIKDSTINIGHTVSGKHMMCVYSSGRVTWDSKALEGIAMVVPPVASAKKVGEPTAVIRKRMQK